MRNEILLRAEPQRAYAIDFLSKLKLDTEKPFVVTIEPYKKKRSLSQNALMWKWISEIVAAVSAYTGHDADELHAFFKQKYLVPTIVEIGDSAVEYFTTTKLTTAEMSVYMDKIYIFATQDLGLLLPLPEQMRAA